MAIASTEFIFAALIRQSCCYHDDDESAHNPGVPCSRFWFYCRCLQALLSF